MCLLIFVVAVAAAVIAAIVIAVAIVIVVGSVYLDCRLLRRLWQLQG